jgi:hypothetical protein
MHPYHTDTGASELPVLFDYVRTFFQFVLCLCQQLHEQRRQSQHSDYLKQTAHFPLPQPQPEQLIGQCPHLPPQMGDFPFFLSFIILRIISATIHMSTMQTIIVPIFAPIHDSILILLS